MKQIVPVTIILIIFLIVNVCTGITPDSGSSLIYPVLKAPQTSLEIKDYVDTAAVWAQENGKDTAISAFGNASGPFVTGDIYIYALDYSGIALALPFQPDKVGTDFTPLLDASGKPYTKVEINLSQIGGGYILYYYPYPAGDQPSTLKISYVRPVDDTYWIGAGVYTSEDRVISQELRQFVDDAKVYALENGKEKALTAFNTINGSFVQGDLYIFAYDYNGTVLAWPYRPDQIGLNRFNATDLTGRYHVQSFINTAQAGGGITDYYSLNPITNVTDLKISYVTDVDGTWMIGAGQYIEPGQIVLQI
ncbi:MAG: sodium:calcium antiporter [Methanomicrobiales archaeon HGW-Methanomicrobiales-4]|nr:MAG: sodium:calcium antiporter [Methanomicrobiales archaeon HGW-Methanomicrobiales-4]